MTRRVPVTFAWHRQINTPTHKMFNKILICLCDCVVTDKIFLYVVCNHIYANNIADWIRYLNIRKYFIIALKYLRKKILRGSHHQAKWGEWNCPNFEIELGHLDWQNRVPTTMRITIPVFFLHFYLCQICFWQLWCDSNNLPLQFVTVDSVTNYLYCRSMCFRLSVSILLWTTFDVTVSTSPCATDCRCQLCYKLPLLLNWPMCESLSLSV